MASTRKAPWSAYSTAKKIARTEGSKRILLCVNLLRQLHPYIHMNPFVIHISIGFCIKINDIYMSYLLGQNAEPFISGYPTVESNPITVLKYS
jgi:hypothetical protein